MRTIKTLLIPTLAAIIAASSLRGVVQAEPKVTDGAVTLENAEACKTDVAASRGVMHVINTMVPPN